MAELDQLLLDPTRLAIVSLLAAAEWAEFGFVRDSVKLSDSALSKQVTKLSQNDYVEVRKGYVGKRPRTWLNLTDTGRNTLAEHISALQAIAEKARSDGVHQPRDHPAAGAGHGGPQAAARSGSEADSGKKP